MAASRYAQPVLLFPFAIAIFLALDLPLIFGGIPLMASVPSGAYC